MQRMNTGVQRQSIQIFGLASAWQNARWMKRSNNESISATRTRCFTATTVIEVGVDVPNANMMIVEHSERSRTKSIASTQGRVDEESTNHIVCLF